MSSKSSKSRNLAVSAISRNSSCPCGSGKKYKRCCYGKRTVPQEPLGDERISTEAAVEHASLQVYFKRRSEELSKIFEAVIEVVIEYEKLACRTVILLGRLEPKDELDRSVRDLLADAFDHLYVARRILIGGYLSVPFSLLRRAFESTSLLHYFILFPDKVKEWVQGKEIGHAEVRKALNKTPMGESAEMMQSMYRFFSKGTHPNRTFVPYRMLGEGNEFVLGAINRPILGVVAEEIQKLLEIWFWFMALVGFFYKERLSRELFGREYLRIAGRAQRIAKELMAARSDLEKSEAGSIREPKSLDK